MSKSSQRQTEEPEVPIDIGATETADPGSIAPLTDRHDGSDSVGAVRDRLDGPGVEGDADDVDREKAPDAKERTLTAAHRGLPKTRSVSDHLMVFAALPGLALLLGATAGFLKWEDSTAREATRAGIESAQVARDDTIALLSYQPDTAAKDLTAARELLVGDFKDSYTSLTSQVVIPDSQQQHIGAVANVTAVSTVSATKDKAVDLVFVNQTITAGTRAPSDAASSVRVTLQKVGDRWLISGFDPV